MRYVSIIHNTYSGTSPIWIPMGQKKMCCLLRCPHLEVEMHARVVHGGGGGKVSCLERCPKFRMSL